MKNYFFLFIFLVGKTVFSQASYNIELTDHWEDTSLVASAAHFNTYNEVWGVVQNGIEYAIIGSTAGTHIFDITQYWNIKEVVFIPGETQGEKLIHRDYHDYKGYLYIVSDENDVENGDTSKLKIVDMSYLPDSVHVVYNEKTLFTRSHNIFIDTLNAKLYTCGGDFNPGVRVFSLANPENPVEVSSVSFDQGSHDVFVNNDTAFVNGGYEGLFIYDFTDNSSPELIGSLTSYDQQGYNHSGWMTDDGNTYILADETHDMDLKVLDISDLTDINILDTIDTELDSNYTIPHNLMIRGNYAYVAYYFDGLYIYNIEDPATPFISGYYDTSERIHTDGKYEGNWGVYCHFPSGIAIASDMQTGLYVFNVNNATGVKEIEKNESPLNIFPNPITNYISIPTLNEKVHNFIIYTIQGKVVLTGKVKNKIINIPSHIANGNYILSISNSTEIFNNKIIINN